MAVPPVLFPTPDAVIAKSTKLGWRLAIDQDTIDAFTLVETQLEQSKRLTKPINWKGFIYADLVREQRPQAVNYKAPR